MQTQKGTNGVSTTGVTTIFIFFETGTLWVLPLTYFDLPKSARAYLFPQSVNTHYFCSGPISVAQFVRNQQSGSTGAAAGAEERCCCIMILINNDTYTNATTTNQHNTTNNITTSYYTYLNILLSVPPEEPESAAAAAAALRDRPRGRAAGRLGAARGAPCYVFMAAMN